MFGVDWDAIFPGSASAEHSVELHSGFARELKGFAELCVADSGGKINERLGRNVRGFVEEVDGFLLRIRLLPMGSTARVLLALPALHPTPHLALLL